MEETSSQNKALIVIFVTVLLNSIGFGIIIPVMPQLIMEVSGQGLAEAAIFNGWLMFSYAIMQFFFAPLMGNLSDRFGRRRVLMLALAVFSIDFFIMAWAPTLIWLFAGRFVAGIAASTQGAANAYITDISAPDERAGRFGMLGAAFGIGFLIGPVLGGILGEYGSRAPFIGGGIIGLANLTFAFFVLKESLPIERRRRFDLSRANPFSAFKNVTANPLMLGLLLALFMYSLGHFVFPATWAYYTIEKFSWSTAEIGYSLGVVGILMVLVQGFLTKLAVPWIGAYRITLLGLCISALSYLGYGLLPEGWMMYAVMIPGALSGFAIPAMQQLMTSYVGDDSQGELQGLITSLYSLTAIIGPPMMTYLFSYFTQPKSQIYLPGAPFIAAAVLTGISVFILVLFPLVAEKKYHKV